MSHRSRLCYIVVDCNDRDRAAGFWSATLDATEEPVAQQSRTIYRRLWLPDSHIRLLLQHTNDTKASKERIHIDIETDDVDAEVKRLQALGGDVNGRQQDRSRVFVYNLRLICPVRVGGQVKLASVWRSPATAGQPDYDLGSSCLDTVDRTVMPM